MILLVVIIYASNQYFQYFIVLNENNYSPISFFEYMTIQFETGFVLNSINTGWIGLLIVWAFQLVITYIIGLLKFNSQLAIYQLERVPIEVTNFAYYHLKKQKTEDQVRTELSKMGWKTKQHQNEVLESIAAILEIHEMRR